VTIGAPGLTRAPGATSDRPTTPAKGARIIRSAWRARAAARSAFAESQAAWYWSTADFEAKPLSASVFQRWYSRSAWLSLAWLWAMPASCSVFFSSTSTAPWRTDWPSEKRTLSISWVVAAVRVTDVEAGTAVVVIVKLTDVAPPGTVTVAGTDADADEL